MGRESGLDAGDQLLVAMDHETLDEVGRRAADLPLDDLLETRLDRSSSASVRREVVYRDDHGQERGSRHASDREDRWNDHRAARRHVRDHCVRAVLASTGRGRPAD